MINYTLHSFMTLIILFSIVLISVFVRNYVFIENFREKSLLFKLFNAILISMTQFMMLLKKENRPTFSAFEALSIIGIFYFSLLSVYSALYDRGNIDLWPFVLMITLGSTFVLVFCLSVRNTYHNDYLSLNTLVCYFILIILAFGVEQLPLENTVIGDFFNGISLIFSLYISLKFYCSISHNEQKLFSIQTKLMWFVSFMLIMLTFYNKKFSFSLVGYELIVSYFIIIVSSFLFQRYHALTAHKNNSSFLLKKEILYAFVIILLRIAFCRL